MNSTFLIVSCLFMVFLTISYFLKVLRVSTPLFLIYFVFCISYIVNPGSENIDQQNHTYDKQVPIDNNPEFFKKTKQTKKLKK